MRGATATPGVGYNPFFPTHSTDTQSPACNAPPSHSARVLAEVRARHAGVHAALGTAEELMDMIRKKSATTLTDWVAKAALGDRDLANLASSLGADAAAIQVALSEGWSNGPVEGQVNRLKAVKTQMYGRTNLDLLAARVLRKGWPPTHPRLATGGGEKHHRECGRAHTWHR
jgi:hypothetical protein